MNPERTGRGKTWMQVSVYLVIAFALMLFPITRVVHAESSAIVAGCAFFLTGLCLIRSRTGLSYAALAVSILASLIPFLILSVTTLFVVSCGCSAYLQGTFIYFLFVPPSVLLGIALATFITSRKVRKPTLIFVVTGVVLATIPVVLTLKYFPQFYVYNHVFGGVLGPIYDEQLYIRSGLVVFRVLTLLWAVLLFLLASRRAIPAALTCILIGCIYLFGGSIGIRGSADSLAASLGTTVQTDHFRIHYDSEATNSDPEVLSAYLEYHYQRLASELASSPEALIDVYLYPSIKVKGRLTGAGTTSVAPVWLTGPQIHMLVSELGRSFDHELAHVFSREFGGYVTNASLRVGLVEGFAVAMEAPDGLPDIDSQVKVIIDDAEGVRRYGAEKLKGLIASPAFWLNRGAVAYTVSGSFVRWLIRTHGAQQFEQVYAGEDFQDVYSARFEDLIGEWKEYIRGLPDDPVASSLGAARFTVPSLFEKSCPHRVNPEVVAYREGMEALRQGDQSGAVSKLSESMVLNGDYQSPIRLLLDVYIHMDSLDQAIEVPVPADSVSGPQLLIARGDLQLATGKSDRALELYDLAQERLPPYAHMTNQLLTFRKTIASNHAGSANIFTESIQESVQDVAARYPDSLRSRINTIRAIRSRLLDPDSVGPFLEAAREDASESELAFIRGQLSVHYFWEGKFEQANEHALGASELYLDDAITSLSEYYSYIADVSRWASLNPTTLRVTDTN